MDHAGELMHFSIRSEGIAIVGTRCCPTASDTTCAIKRQDAKLQGFSVIANDNPADEFANS